MSDIPVYDVSGIYFCHGITNFCIANVLDALRSAKISDRTDLKADVCLTVYDKLAVNNTLDYAAHDTVKWCRITITIDPTSDYSGPIVTSTLSDASGRSVILRTREY